MKFIVKIWQKRVVRFALIGAIGVPINLVALAFFLYVLGLAGLEGDMLEIVATICSFEVGTILNFILNQFITYPDQLPKTLNEWLIKSFKAQIANLSAFLLATLLSLFLSVVLQFNPFVSNTLGIICNVAYKYLVSDRFVFRTKTVAAPAVESTPVEDPVAHR